MAGFPEQSVDIENIFSKHDPAYDRNDIVYCYDQIFRATLVVTDFVIDVGQIDLAGLLVSLDQD